MAKSTITDSKQKASTRTVVIRQLEINVACLHDYQLPEHMQLATTGLRNLIARIGAEHVERRLKVETEHEAQLFGQGLIFFNLENWYSAPRIIKIALRLMGLYGRARRNADHIVIKRNTIV